jgi:hypothetical protein
MPGEQQNVPAGVGFDVFEAKVIAPVGPLRT